MNLGFSAPPNEQLKGAASEKGLGKLIRTPFPMRVAPNDKSLGRADLALARRRVESVRLNTSSYALDWARVHHSQPNTPASNRYHWDSIRGETV
jgi:hypothetical protein